MKAMVKQTFGVVQMLKATPSEINKQTHQKFRIGLAGSPSMVSVFREVLTAQMVLRGDEKVEDFIEVLPLYIDEDLRKTLKLDAVIYLLSVEDANRENFESYRRIYKLSSPAHLFVEEPETLEEKERLYQVMDSLFLIGREWIGPISQEVIKQKASTILSINPSIEMALGYRFPLLRDALILRLIHNTGFQNMAIALASSLPSNLPIIGIIIGLLSVAGETTVLTMNQLKLCLQIAGIYGLELNLLDRIKELWPLVGSALGFRTLARTLVGFVPIAGPSIKAMIAYGGTHIVGYSVKWYYETGRRLSPEEKKRIYLEAKKKAILTLQSYIEKVKGSLKSLPLKNEDLGDVSEISQSIEKMEKEVEILRKAVEEEENLEKSSPSHEQEVMKEEETKEK